MEPEWNHCNQNEPTRPKWSKSGAEGRQREQKGTKNSQKITKGNQQGSTGSQRGSKGSQNWQTEANGNQNRGIRILKKVKTRATREPNGNPKEAQESQTEPTGSQRYLNWLALGGDRNTVRAINTMLGGVANTRAHP